jgi:hypothetical protein
VALDHDADDVIDEPHLVVAVRLGRLDELDHAGEIVEMGERIDVHREFHLMLRVHIVSSETTVSLRDRCYDSAAAPRRSSVIRTR